MNTAKCLIFFVLWVLLFFLLSYSLQGLYAAKVMDSDVEAQLVVKGPTRPTSKTFLDENDILVTEKQGKVQRIIGNHILAEPVLDLGSIVHSTGERGLLSFGISL